MRLKERMDEHFSVKIEFDGHRDGPRLTPPVASLLKHSEGAVIPLHMIGCPLCILSMAEEHDHLLEPFTAEFLERSGKKGIGLVVRIVDQPRPATASLALSNTSGKEAIEILIEAPQDGDLPINGDHLPESFLVLFGHALLLPYDQMLILPKEGCLFFLRSLLSMFLPLLRSLRFAPSCFLASLVSLPLDAVLNRAKRIENQFVYLFDNVEDTELVFHVLPHLLKSILVQRRAISNNHIGLDSHILQVLQERIHVFLVVGVVNGKIYSEIAERIGGVQEHLPGIMKFIDAQNTGEMFHGPAATLLSIYLPMSPLEALMDIPDGNGQAEVFLHPLLNLPVRQPVSNKRVGNSIPHLEGELPIPGNPWDWGLKVFAATTTSTINAYPGTDQDRLSQSDVMNKPFYRVNSLTAHPTRGTGKKISADWTDTQCEHLFCRYERHNAWPESSFSWTANWSSQSISAEFRPFFCPNSFPKQPLCMN